MKKLKKQDFRRLAWKGVAAGVMLASQASAHQIADANSYANMLAAGCGASRQGCNAQSYNRAPQSGCGNVAYNPAPTSGCNANSSGNGYTSYNMPSQGCGAAAGAPPKKYYYTDNQGKWQAGNPPAEYTNVPANPEQDHPVNNNGQQSSQWNQRPQQANSNQSGYFADASTSSQPSQQFTEQTLPSKLNPAARAAFERMSPEGKTMALKLANQSCKGQNDCKGLNSCRTDKNSCAGMGSCKGTSKGPFDDKNTAVTVAAKAMAEKRMKAAGASNSRY